MIDKKIPGECRDPRLEAALGEIEGRQVAVNFQEYILSQVFGIVRRPGNPFLRYVGGAALQATDEPSIPPTAAQEKLPL